MRPVALHQIKAGIQRLREKGGANPESLHDLLNGYVTASRTTKSRPGTAFEYTLPNNTRGLMAFGGVLVTFSHIAQELDDDRFRVEPVIHPTEPESPLADIHFAQGFLGFPYVVAEFQNGDILHYWLQQQTEWAADTVYQPGDIVQPTTPNGYAYRATRADAAGNVWQPNTVTAEGDVVEPTEFNGYRYTATSVAGDPPHTGETEPTWIAEDGAEVIEDADALPPDPNTQTGGDGSVTLPDDVIGRYGRRSIEP